MTQSTDAAPSRFPLWPLAATTAMQILATMAAYSVPALAPAIVRDLGIDGAWIGYFVALVFGVGIVSSLASAGWVHRHGAVRVSQGILVATIAMLAIGATGSVAALALGAVVLGLGYGASAAAGTHLLVPLTPPRALNRVISLRQIGVPAGGMLGSLALPPLALRYGWETALLLAAAPALLVVFALELPRRDWDRKPEGTAVTPNIASLLRLLAASRELQLLSIASVVYAGMQVGVLAFLTVQLTSRAGFDLVAAGQALATYQVSGAIARPISGWLADSRFTARQIMALYGVIMGVTGIAIGQFSGEWSAAMIFATCAIAGATAAGYTGIAYAEFARLGGPRGTETTGLGSAVMFLGALVLPSACAALLTATGSYAAVYTLLAGGTIAAGLLLASGRRA